jgi:hypothetical protein
MACTPRGVDHDALRKFTQHRLISALRPLLRVACRRRRPGISPARVGACGHSVTVVQYIGTAQFWFESLRNWRSEFFSDGMMVVLSIVLRQWRSPESKPSTIPTARPDMTRRGR